LPPRGIKMKEWEKNTPPRRVEQAIAEGKRRRSAFAMRSARQTLFDPSMRSTVKASGDRVYQPRLKEPGGGSVPRFRVNAAG
jgi:hypothetical protein